MLENNLEKITEDINSFEPLAPYIISSELLENKSGKFSSLIDTTTKENFTYTLKNQDYVFKFNEPIYIDSISFILENNSHLEDLEVEIIDVLTKKKSTYVFKKNHIQCTPQTVIKQFVIKAPKRYLNKINLVSIKILGYKLTDLSSINEKSKTIIEYKTLLGELYTKAEKKFQDIKDKEELSLVLSHQIEDLQNVKLPALEAEISDYEKILENLKEKQQKENTTILNLESQKSQLSSYLDDLNSEIPIKRKELKELIENKNIFSTEMKEYIEQGNEDIKLYTKLSLIPWIIILGVTSIIFYRSHDLALKLTDALLNSSQINIEAILLSKIPFTLTVISILFVSYEISKLFIKNIIMIQTQKRVFAKIGIIAKDVADSSIKDLEIEEEDKFHLRAKLKMDLLKAHLANDIGEKYEYKVDSSLMELLIKSFKQKAEKYLNVDDK